MQRHVVRDVRGAGTLSGTFNQCVRGCASKSLGESAQHVTWDCRHRLGLAVDAVICASGSDGQATNRNLKCMSSLVFLLNM